MMLKSLLTGKSPPPATNSPVELILPDKVDDQGHKYPEEAEFIQQLRKAYDEKFASFKNGAAVKSRKFKNENGDVMMWEKCKNCFELRQERDFLLKKCEAYDEQVQELAKNAAEQDKKYTEAQKEISRLNKTMSLLTSQIFPVTEPAVPKEPEDTKVAGDVEEHEDQTPTCLWVSERNGERCGKVFETAQSMAIHVKRDHMSESDPNGQNGHVCSWEGCKREGLPFNYKYMLSEHLRMHTGEKPYLCTIKGCGKRFAQSQSLRSHLNIHTKRKFPCKFPGCHKVFSFKQTLDDHYRVTHLGDDRIKCPFPGCGRTFAKSQQLRRHTVTHTGVKAYVCDEPGCGAAFGYEKSLAGHRWKHTGHNPNVCSVEGCGKTYSDRSALGKHMRSHRRSQKPPTVD